MGSNACRYRKWLWFAGLWLAGVLSLTLVGFGIRLMLNM